MVMSGWENPAAALEKAINGLDQWIATRDCSYQNLTTNPSKYTVAV